LSESPAGIVYEGVDPQGRLVSVAVLTRGAASDAAARDRFRAAITGERDVVAGAQAEGPAPWVAVGREPGRPGAERFLDAVVFEGRFHGLWGRRGPQFRPYWVGSREPAVVWPAPPGPLPEVPVGRGLAGTVLFLAGLLGVLALLLALLFACRPTTPFPKPPPPSDVPSESSVPVPSPVSPSPLPSPSPDSPVPVPSPAPGGSGGGGGGQL
jgi:hypothetical protein